MSKQINTVILLLCVTLNCFAQEKKEVLDKKLYTDGGCAKSYFKKAKKVNQIVGLSIGGTSIAASAALPFAWIFTLGGLGAAGESLFDLGHEKNNKKYKETFKTKNYEEKTPIIRYPIALGYFDILNTIELAKKLKSENDDIYEYLKMYIRASALSQFSKQEYKTCKKLARSSGINRYQIKQIELQLLEHLMAMDNNPSQDSHSKDKAKNEFINCLISITSYNDETIYPIADMLLAKYEIQNYNILNWRLKGISRLYSKVIYKANQENKDVDIENYFELVNKLSEQKDLCLNDKKPMNKKNFIKEVITTIGK